MKNKTLFAIFVSIMLLLTSTICFAAESENIESTDLGNEITASIESTEKSVENVTERNADASGSTVEDDTKDVGNTIKDGAEDVGNAVEDGADDVKNGTKDGENTVENGTDESKNSVSGETSNFSSGETTTDSTETGMSTRTWVWIIIAVVAIIIIAAVWYYAANNNR